MTKKFLFIIGIALVITFASMTMVFAATNDAGKTTLGNEITESMNKTRKNVDNLVDSDMMTKAKNEVKDAGQDFKNGIENMTDENKTENKAVAGTTGNYRSGDVITNDDNIGMSGTTWVWIIVAAIVGIVLLSIVTPMFDIYSQIR